MDVHLKPDLEAILRKQVEGGRYASIEDALEADVRGLEQDDPVGDLFWAKPYLEAADRDIEAGRTLSEEETYAELEQRYGKL